MLVREHGSFNIQQVNLHSLPLFSKWQFVLHYTMLDILSSVISPGNSPYIFYRQVVRQYCTVYQRRPHQVIELQRDNKFTLNSSKSALELYHCLQGNLYLQYPSFSRFTLWTVLFLMGSFFCKCLDICILICIMSVTTLRMLFIFKIFVAISHFPLSWSTWSFGF